MQITSQIDNPLQGLFSGLLGISDGTRHSSHMTLKPVDFPFTDIPSVTGKCTLCVWGWGL